MAAYSTRNEYFENICYMSKLIAHNRPVTVEDDDILRSSFFRINDEDELNAACVHWIHFPCVVHTGFAMRYRETGKMPGNRINSNNLLFLAPAQMVGNVVIAEKIEDAYDAAEDAMNQFIGYMQNDFETNGNCGGFFNLDMSRMRAEMIGPVNGKLFGWQLIFEDEQQADEAAYDEVDWYE